MTALLVEQMRDSKKEPKTPRKPTVEFPEWDGKGESLLIWLQLVEVYKADKFFESVEDFQLIQ